MFVHLFNVIPTFLGLFNAKYILPEEQLYYLTHSWEDKGVHTFPKGICLKMNVIAWLEFERQTNDKQNQLISDLLGVVLVFWGGGQQNELNST